MNPDARTSDLSHLTGAERIAEERHRQGALGYSQAHDKEHESGQLLVAAQCYLESARVVEESADTQEAVARYMRRHGEDPDTDEDFQRRVENPARYYHGWDARPREWPWDDGWDPSPDAIRNLEKAGALIAAEIDRLAGRV